MDEEQLAVRYLNVRERRKRIEMASGRDQNNKIMTGGFMKTKYSESLTSVLKPYTYVKK